MAWMGGVGFDVTAHSPPPNASNFGHLLFKYIFTFCLRKPDEACNISNKMPPNAVNNYIKQIGS